MNTEIWPTDAFGLSKCFLILLVVGLIATLTPYQKVWWNLFEQYMRELCIFFIMAECSQQFAYAKQNLSAYVWWMQSYLPFSITGKML